MDEILVHRVLKLHTTTTAISSDMKK